MATTPTNLPVPSESPRDLKFNAGKIDEFVTSLVNTYVDRFGNEHYTIEGLRWLAQQAIAQYGWIPVGTFQAGATLTLPNQILKDTTDGEYYRWDGALPKTVPVDSTPDSTGGVGSGAWINVGDSTLRALLASANGSAQIGTSHRGLLSSDLNAIDRRPSGYGDSVSAVLANGQDVEIEKTYLLSSPILPADYQVIDGKGGNLQMSAIARAISVVSKKGVAIWNARAIGTVVNGPSAANVAYGVVAEDCSNLKIYGVDASKFSGAVELLRTTDFIIRDVFARNMRYHSDVAAGGYGVLLEGCSRGLVDGINFRASTADGDLGRHALYISVDVLGNFCEDIIVKNLIASYVNIDNRNMPAAVVRRSNRCMIEDFNINGSNGGIGLNADNGIITDLQIRNGHMKIIQYDDNAVYGISGGVDGQPNTVVGLRVDNYTFEGEVKSGVTPATVSLHAIAMTCRDSYFTNTRIKSHGSANPILVRPGTFNTTFDGIKDFVTAGSATAPLIRFQGSNSNIKVFNIDTARSPFAGLDNVTDLTVNWERFARIVSANGTVTTTDTESLISTVSATGTGELTVSFKPHVTADAVRKCTVTPASVAGLVILPEISGKNLILRFYNGSGALVPLGASIVSADIRLHS
ncbi:hypothetical protein [Enterobacter hormaechei]|uniref:tail fiber/spike domain-containing protein n=1 Tax=Enterobacter hormaechei TaxID=158836 RepID=UPI001B949038|nr:hypothetical protein [Enterobacter hormaechei]MBU5618592.1 hypothetical protein [Enterobacteriaceae bacterium S5_ASV_15]HBC9699557.1 hypothetical protein [Escherichia coli]HBC9733193.1 hypothetical protein [Escherichia coli]HBD0032791.1 hypothetical protein [Escherichia coli]HBD0101382.1 hypothetical protein [Escherichia coli]